MTMPSIKVVSATAVQRCECFTFTYPDERGTVIWDITKAKQIVSDGRKPQLHPTLAELQFMLSMNGKAGEIDDAHAMTRDLSQPLIAIATQIEEMPDGRINVTLTCIDGWHRIRKAVLTSHPALDMHILHPYEDLACRIDPATML